MKEEIPLRDMRVRERPRIPAAYAVQDAVLPRTLHLRGEAPTFPGLRIIRPVCNTSSSIAGHMLKTAGMHANIVLALTPEDPAHSVLYRDAWQAPQPFLRKFCQVFSGIPASVPNAQSTLQLAR